jgi:hypothetical protein
VALLREALKVAGVEKQLGIAAVRQLVVNNLSLDRSAGMESAFAKWLAS